MKLTTMQKYRIAREASGVSAEDLAKLWKCNPTLIANVAQGRTTSARVEQLLSKFIRDNFPYEKSNK